MARKTLSTTSRIILAFFLLALLFLGIFYYDVIWDKLVKGYLLCNDREKFSLLITSYGPVAPVVFILIQMSQVVFAPMPGESTFGLVGGYLFGTVRGFLYSSIGLTAGSLVNFAIGRFLGNRYVRKMIPDDQMMKFDALVKHQGIFVLFLLFITPGFPKDYLCLFLGLTAIPMRVFMVLTIVGRIPGTFTFSLLGAGLYDRHYYLVLLVFGLLIGVTIIAYRHKSALYQWIDRINGDKENKDF